MPGRFFVYQGTVFGLQHQLREITGGASQPTTAPTSERGTAATFVYGPPAGPTLYSTFSDCPLSKSVFRDERDLGEIRAVELRHRRADARFRLGRTGEHPPRFAFFTRKEIRAPARTRTVTPPLASASTATCSPSSPTTTAEPSANGN